MHVPYVKSFDIAGYQYSGETLCAACVIDALVMEGVASPAARDMRAEDALDQIAGANGIDRADEASFDSGEFPKVIFVDQTSGDRCGNCNEELCP